MRFTAPVFIGDSITTTATVSGIREPKGVVTLDIACTNQHSVVTLTGESVVMLLRT
jgi:acyl dehydratase